MRDRLIRLIAEANQKSIEAKPWTPRQAIEIITDHLLASGVIVPPCKVGDIVYSIQECSCENIDGVHTECEFYGYGTDDIICTIPNGAKCPYQYRAVECYVTDFNLLMFTREWGKTVFLTKKEAEKHLRKGAGNERLY